MPGKSVFKQNEMKVKKYLILIVSGIIVLVLCTIGLFIPFNPILAPYNIDPNLDNIHGADKLSFLTKSQRQLLAQNGFVICTSPKLDMYELYEPNPSPFITSDCVFHAYHVLLSDTIRNLEEAYVIDQMSILINNSFNHMHQIYKESPIPLKNAARKALSHLAVAQMLLNPSTQLDSEVNSIVLREVERIQKARFIGKIEGDKYKRDYTIFQPIAGYERNENLRRYFQVNRYFSQVPLRFETIEQSQVCALVSLSICSNKTAREAYLNLSRLTRLLAGEPEDITPLEILSATQSILGDSVSPDLLSQKENSEKLHEAFNNLKQPLIADQPQDIPGADPNLGWSLRILPPGITIRAEIFQKIQQNTLWPASGKHMAYILGNKSVSIGKSETKLLTEGTRKLEKVKNRFPKGLGVHTSSLVVLSKLSEAKGERYPQFMNTREWELKTANTQMAAWSQVEHDVFLYAKTTAVYAGGYMKKVEFHGYVEPVPEYYAALAALVHYTRTTFEELEVFQNISRMQNRSKQSPFGRNSIVATAKHFQILEEILLKLKKMSEKELENKTFSKSEIEFLKEFGNKLKYLAFNESNVPRAREPMSCIVRLVREYLTESGVYFGTGRPLKIVVIVPWRGELFSTVGGIYSYYEFWRSLNHPLSDTEWKKETRCSYSVQQERPWLVGSKIGLDEEIWSTDQFKTWLPKEYFEHGSSSNMVVWKVFQTTWDREGLRFLDSVVYVKLDHEAQVLAGKEFSKGLYNKWVRAALFLLIKDVNENFRRKTGIESLSTIISNIQIQRSKSRRPTKADDYRCWIYFSLLLLKDQYENRDVVEHVDKLRVLLGGEDGLKEYAGDAELTKLLQSSKGR
jgi:hypothetical protein